MTRSLTSSEKPLQAQQSTDTVILEHQHFQQLLDVLRGKGYQPIGPTIRDSAIVYDELTSVADLPIGWTDEQEASTYRLKKRQDKAFFGYNVGPQSWKQFLFPPRIRLFAAKKNGKGWEIETDPSNTPAMRYAFVGVRSCELKAIEIQDKVFNNGEYLDPIYKVRREGIFIVAVNCTQAGGTCFCASMGTGPKVRGAFDLALTEVIDEAVSYFVVEIGSERGAEVISEVPHRSAEKHHTDAADRIVENTAQRMGRTLDINDLRELLLSHIESPHWDDVARRCLTCTNCTLVCPTCFCSTIEDVTDLNGERAERWRRWDSCFTVDYARVAGGNFRLSPRARYRHWLTHKLASWIEQFGTWGCVGCGRCITWCPVGIDITTEVDAIRNSQAKNQG
ncbi:MAG: 4Fe-4S dicluster domain-containing protein [Bacteroidota bacterium]